MDDQIAFLAAIRINQEDEILRSVYSDWLLEHDQPEEAERQRKIVPAIRWLKLFARKWNFFDASYPYAAGHYDKASQRWIDDLTATANPEAWLEMIKEAISCGYVVAQGSDLHSAGELDSGDEAEFWKNIEIYTGQKFDQNHREGFGWSCSC
jgi:uncharacterized protein (TIGR02996 family)